MPRDHDLLVRVKLRTTGANVHDVNGMLGVYNASVSCLDRPPESEKQKVSATDSLRWSVAVLSEFADTGDIKKAKENHPIIRYCVLERRVKARWATAGDPEEGRLCQWDGKAEGVWPLGPVPTGFKPNRPTDLRNGCLYGTVTEKQT